MNIITTTSRLYCIRLDQYVYYHCVMLAWTGVRLHSPGPSPVEEYEHITISEVIAVL